MLSWPSATNASRSSVPSVSSLRTTATCVSVRPPFSPRRTADVRSSSVSATTHVDWLAVGRRRRQVERQADGRPLRASVDAQREVRPLRRGLQELARRALVAAVDLVTAIDDHLRRVDLVRAEDLRVRLLADAESLGRERIPPALMIPVVDVQRQRDDFDVGDRLLAQELRQVCVSDAERFLALAESSGSRLTHIVETHIHSDYLSGAVSLSGRTGATILAAARGRYAFDHQPVDEGQELTVGGMTLRSLATPGHTFEHLAWELRDTDSGATLAILSGGSLLRSGAGRTDLSGDAATSELTRLQFESIHRLSSMPDGSVLLPTHDGGSTCSIGIVSADGMPWWDLPSEPGEFPTIGGARDANRYLPLPDEEEFARDFLSERGPAPAYFPHVARLNREGPAAGIRPSGGCPSAAGIGLRPSSRPRERG